MTNPLEGTTAGPWKATSYHTWTGTRVPKGTPERPYEVEHWQVEAEGQSIALAQGLSEADARLIASAPDLATENATLKSKREEQERLIRSLQTENATLRTHLRDVVIPATTDIDEAAGDFCRAYGEFTRLYGTSDRTLAMSKAYMATVEALARLAAVRDSTRELVGDG